MSGRAGAARLCVAAAISIACGATSRHKVLTFFFDGVPPPKVGEASAQAHGPASPAQARRVGYREHGPYAARQCSACHQQGATNALVAPGDQLCFQCHELRLDRAYVHGPLASGGCRACHDPHSSRYRYLLVSESDDFCLRCHERRTLAAVAEHLDAGVDCTSCHDAHMSDRKYLLK